MKCSGLIVWMLDPFVILYCILVLPLSLLKMIHSHFLCFSDFDCILTNLELKKLDKNRFQLPEEERERTQSILKRALDVEKGVSESAPVTEEHPDGCKYSTVELHLSKSAWPLG